MGAYIIRRSILIIPTLFVASLIVFFIIRLIPGNIIELMVIEGEHHSEATMESIKHDLGLDVPVLVQYVRWVGGILKGDLGDSFWTRMPVTNEIKRALPVTFELALMAFVVAMILGAPIGVYSAIRQDTVGDYVGRSFAIGCIAVPGFWIATLVMVFPAIWWGWSPPIIFIHFTEDPMANLGMLIIPAIILGMSLSGVTMRMTRNMMLEVLRQDYIRTAWSKGLRERVVVTRHALKNALIPVLTLVGLYVPFLIGGAVIIEQIFVLPGVGRVIVGAAFQRDYPMISGVMFVMGIIILVVNLLVDLTYAALDPRIQYK